MTELQTLIQVIDPVCGMKIAPEKAAGNYEYKGETYYFCSKSCLAKFQANPENFLKPESKAQANCCGNHAHKPTTATVQTSPENSKKVEYTCPMHPEIVQIGPGSCPICGMALEQKTAAHH